MSERYVTADLTAELVLLPAGMSRSARIHRRLPLRDDLARALAVPYHVDAGGRVVESAPPGPQGDGAAGGVISTAHDLARFDVALTTDRLLSPASRERMWTAGRAPSGALLPYGIGWFVQEYQGETLLWHSGLWEGAYSAIYLRVPARRLTLILLANSDGLSWDNPLDAAVIERSPFVQAFLAAFHTHGSYLSPFYSPELLGDSPHSWFGPKPGWWPLWLPFSPAPFILPIPASFRFSCYYLGDGLPTELSGVREASSCHSAPRGPPSADLLGPEARPTTERTPGALV